MWVANWPVHCNNWAGGLMVVTGALVSLGLGVEFVPRLEEGDLVVQTARLPSLSAEEALREAGRVERALRSFPEVERVAGRTGSPALATDPMGMEETDFVVHLRPRSEWTTASTSEGLTEAFGAALKEQAPGPEFTFTQPIEMRFNELLEGIPSDVGVRIYGVDLGELERAGAAVVKKVPGAADVKAPVLEGSPGIDLQVDTTALARQGIDGQTIHGLVAAVQRGYNTSAAPPSPPSRARPRPCRPK
jgi:cobalt-zinc-cadmium resistance protein CzcA